MTGDWNITLAPIIGLAVVVVTQIVCAHASRRVGVSIVTGAASGLVGTVIVLAINSSGAGTPAARLSMWAVAVVTFLALAFGYWAFVNLNVTSLRIRMLREMLHSRDGISQTDLMAQYSSEEFLRRRLERLKNSGQLSVGDGCWRLQSRTYLILARILAAFRAVLVPARPRDTSSD